MPGHDEQSAILGDLTVLQGFPSFTSGFAGRGGKKAKGSRVATWCVLLGQPCFASGPGGEGVAE